MSEEKLYAVKNGKGEWLSLYGLQNCECEVEETGEIVKMEAEK